MEYTKGLNGPSSWYKRLPYLSKRFSKEAREKRQRTYILPTKFGLVYGSLCFVLLLMGMAYGNNLVYIVCFYLTTMGLALAKRTNDQIDDIQIEDVFTKDVFAEDQQVLFVTLRNKSSTQLNQIEIRIARGKVLLQVDLKPSESRIVEVLWHPEKRGYQKIPTVRIQSSYPSDLFGAWKIYRQKKEVLVFARRNGIQNFPESSFASADSIGVLKEIRDYVPGDSPKRIHWRSLAKSGQLRTLIHEGSEGQTCHLDWKQVQHLSTEEQIEQLTLWVSLADSQNTLWTLRMPDHEFKSDSHDGKHEALKHLALWKFA